MGEKKRRGSNKLRPHTFIEGVEHKFCIDCEAWKSLPEFHGSTHSSDGLYAYCKECSRAQDRRRYKERVAKHGSEWARRQEYFRRYNESGRRKQLVNARYRQLRDQVFAGYGNKCVKCGFDDKRALQLDHVHGDGREDRKQHKRATLLRRIIKAGFPARYQLLCANCNTIKMYENREFPGWSSHEQEGLLCNDS